MHVGCRVVYRRGWSAWCLAGVCVLEVHWNAGVTAWWCQGSALNRAGIRVLEVRWEAGSITWLCQRSTLNRAGVRVLEVRWITGIATQLCQKDGQALHGVGDLPESRSCRAGSVLVERHCTGCEGSSPRAGICPLRIPVEATPESVVEQEGVLQDGAKMIFELARSSGVVVNSNTSTTGVMMVAISINGCHMPNQRRIERGSVSRARESGEVYRWRPDNSVCVYYPEGGGSSELCSLLST